AVRRARRRGVRPRRRVSRDDGLVASVARLYRRPRASDESGAGRAACRGRRRSVNVRLLALVLALGERVDDREPALVRAGHRAVRQVLAVDDDIRRRADAVAPHEIVRALYLRVNAERIERLTERFLVDTEAREERRERILGLEQVAVDVNLGEERLVHLLELAERLGGVERARVQAR